MIFLIVQKGHAPEKIQNCYYYNSYLVKNPFDAITMTTLIASKVTYIYSFFKVLNNRKQTILFEI